MMATYKHYVPVLKCKQSELLALRDVTPQRKTTIIPLFEIQEATGGAIESKKIAKDIQKSWNSAQPTFVDVDAGVLFKNAQAAATTLSQVAAEMLANGFQVTPVTGLSRHPAYQSAINSLSSATNGIAIRLTNSDLGNLPQLGVTLTSFISSLNLLAGKVDIIIDFGAFLPNQVGTIATAALSTINSLPTINSWRSITVVGTAFPASLSSFTPVTPGLTPRAEWILWLMLVQMPNIKRTPGFGDYTTVYPDMPLIDFQQVPIAAKIKYTTDADWLILRWHQGRQHPWSRFYDLCDVLVTSPYYKGANFSWGDQTIGHCAARTASSGNPGMWVRIGINHHLSLVVDQVSSHSSPSVPGTQGPGVH